MAGEEVFFKGIWYWKNLDSIHFLSCNQFYAPKNEAMIVFFRTHKYDNQKMWILFKIYFKISRQYSISQSQNDLGCGFCRNNGWIMENMDNMAFPVVEFSREGYKNRKVFG